MTNLTGKTVLVAGGSGEVGEGITRQFLQAGAKVIVPSRNAEKLAQLKGWMGDLADNRVTVEGHIGTIEGAEAIRDAAGDIDHIVASLGGWWQGKNIPEVDLDLWHQLIDNSLTAHFITAKVFLPVLPDGASYTLINGGAALHAFPQVAPIAVSAAAQVKLGQHIAVENQHLRANNLILATPVITRSRPQGQAGWITADDAGKYCVYLASDANTQTGETIVFNAADQVPA